MPRAAAAQAPAVLLLLLLFLLLVQWLPLPLPLHLLLLLLLADADTPVLPLLPAWQHLVWRLPMLLLLVADAHCLQVALQLLQCGPRWRPALQLNRCQLRGDLQAAECVQA
jgi:hypothetical protein